MSPAEGALVLAAVTAGSAAQAVSGLGFSLVSVPFIVSVLGARDGVALCVVLSLALNLRLLARDPRAVRWRPVVLLLAAASVAVVAVGAVAAQLSGAATRLGSGLAIVVGVALLASGRRAPRLRGVGGALLAGVASGAMNVLASVAGPPIVLWAGNRGWSARTTRVSLQGYFAPLNVVTLLVLGVPRLPIWLYVGAAAAIVLGTAAGLALGDRVSDERAQQVTLAVAALGGLALVGAAVAGMLA